MEATSLSLERRLRRPAINGERRCSFCGRERETRAGRPLLAFNYADARPDGAVQWDERPFCTTDCLDNATGAA